MKLTALHASVLLLGTACCSALAQQAPPQLLHAESFAHYVTQFQQDELAATGHLYLGPLASTPTDVWTWMQREVPLFESSDKRFEEMYYFRWYAWHKHLVKLPSGYVITEWLPEPSMPNEGRLPDAAPFHMGEARWLHSRSIAEEDAQYWYDPSVDIRKYSAPMATAVQGVEAANGDHAFAAALLPQLTRVYEAWEQTQRDSNGLYWSIDTRDAMEKSISGDGYRPTLNSYMVSDARAIAAIAAEASQPAITSLYSAKAESLNALIETKLWNPKDEFYEVLSPSADSGIRSQKRFIDPGTVLRFAGVREQIGYLPWAYSSPARSHEVAWKQLFDPRGFDAPYGATTAERRSPRFRFFSTDQCTWNGPAWPFAMTQTLLALATDENLPGSHVLHAADYYKLFERYVEAQHITLPQGRRIDWIDEDYDADTDDWIAKRMLAAKGKQVGRGNYYNHSGFADPLITGLIGLRPRTDRRLVLHPLLPTGAWQYFAMDALPYHGHMLTILFDDTGRHYHRGRGLKLYVDGRLVAHRRTLGPLEAMLPTETR
jgi:hypothetical protein